MFNWLRGMFGKGKVRIKWAGLNEKGQIESGFANIPYAGSWDEDACFEKLRKELRYQFGITVNPLSLSVVEHIKE